jgi:hypothetical protein
MAYFRLCCSDFLDRDITSLSRDGHGLALRSNVNHLARASFATDHPHPREGQKMLRCGRPDPIPTKGMKIEGMVVWLAQGDWVPSTDLCVNNAFQTDPSQGD